MVTGTGLYVPDLKGELVDICQVTAKTVYRVLLWTEYKTPAAELKWQQLYESQDHVHSDEMWIHWRTLPYRLTREVCLQSFVFRLLHRIIPCNAYLCQIKIKQDNGCSYCNRKDDLYHFFFGCAETELFWARVGRWLKGNSAVVALPRNISELEFLLGVIDTDDNDFRLNFILYL